MLDEDSRSLIEDEYCVEKELDKEMSFDEVSMGKTAGFSSPQAEKRKAKNPASKKNLLIRIATSALVNIYKFIAMGVMRFYFEVSASFTQRTERPHDLCIVRIGYPSLMLEKEKASA